MSLNAAFFAASSGLQITARGSQIVADNIANASTDGYVARRLTQSATVLGGTGVGVTATGISRHIPQVLLEDLRAARAQNARADVVSGFWRAQEQSLGSAGSPGALATELTTLETALLQASTTPESAAALIGVAQAAQNVTTAFHRMATDLETEKDRTNLAFAAEVDTLNSALASVSRLNSDIVRIAVTQGDTSRLVEQRQALIDQIALSLPVKEIPREFGRSTLVAADGTVLVDREAVQFSLQLPADAPARLTFNGRTLTEGHALVAEGRLGGFLEIRDRHIPAHQLGLDQLAHDLIRRFSGPQADPTLASNQPGLFQERQVPDLPQFAPSLAARVMVAPSIDPANPSGLWRLRDGMGAVAPGPVGSDTVLSSLLAQLRAALPGDSNGTPRQSSFEKTATLAAEVATRRLSSESLQAQTSARAEGLSQRALSFGVDTDTEMQRLLLLERQYAANAKVIAAVDSMLQTLLEI